MELHLDTHHFTHRKPDWAAAATAGFAACAFFSAVEMLAVLLVTGQSPWIPSRMVAAILLGTGVLPPPATFDVTVVAAALAVHFALGVGLGLILGAIVAPFRLDSDVATVSIAGAVFGLAVYLFNFYVMTDVFPWFAASRGWLMLAGHLVFGAFAGYMYWLLAQLDVQTSPQAFARR
ncbi:hypothetical protein [Pandoraea sp.]|uniref:hypothetical protein n=1 Tax=Pandoraea sp. TaxID=1883445 RepID=UPI0011FD6D38|nr:hypothetical protein [Pandoraea sp.]TAL54874.1 MAG: hypothetical protein EPN80_10350 [Pandoraea sp.]TAM18358.1 MAG: hypothetical protein EPN65_06290 [Pandoraea sp.]